MKRSYYRVHNDLRGEERLYEDYYSVIDFLNLVEDKELWIIDKKKITIEYKY